MPLNAVMLVVFSEPIDPASLDGAIQLFRGAVPVAGRVEAQGPANLAAAFLPGAPLAAGATYRLVVTEAVADQDGENLPSPVAAEFTTGLADSTALSQVAFVSYRDDPTLTTGEIYVMNADGSGIRRVTSTPAGRSNYSPSWSPDGRRLAFVSDYHLFIINADGSGLTRVVDEPGAFSGAWSRVGTMIAFATWRHGDAEIYVVNADGTGLRRLTNNPADDVTPAWSPDGTRIVFARIQGTDGSLYVMNADGIGAVSLLGESGTNDGEPAWSPDGTRIAFVRRDDAYDSNIYVVNLDGSEATRLTSLLGHELGPTWSPDGTRIAFVNEGFGQQVYVMNADGSGLTRLTNDPRGALSAAWSPVGRVPPLPTWAIRQAPTASGDGQRDTVGATLSQPLRAAVLRGGLPAEGVPVTWTASHGSVSPGTSTTDASGIAAASWTLGPTAGNWAAQASITDGAASPLVPFDAVARAGNPAGIRGAVWWDPLVYLDTVNATVDYAVYVTDSHGAGNLRDTGGNGSGPGVPVAWAIIQGGGSLVPTQGATDSLSVSVARHALGSSEGTHRVTATLLNGPSIEFQVNAVGAVIMVDTGTVFPPEVAVGPGRTVGWIVYPDDGMPHNITFDDDPTGPASSGTGNFFTHTRTFTATGSYPYRCTLHAGEIGTITVR